MNYVWHYGDSNYVKIKTDIDVSNDSTVVDYHYFFYFFLSIFMTRGLVRTKSFDSLG